MIYVFMTVLSLIFMRAYVFVENHVDNNMVNLSEKVLKNLLKSIFFILSFLVVFIPSAIRYFVGIDYTTYTFFQIPATLNGRTDIKVEPLYKILIKFGFWLGKGETYQYIFALTAFIIIIFVFLYIKDQSTNLYLSVFIFMFGGFFTFSLSGMRQSIAVAIFLYSLKFIKENKIFPYMVCVLIATLFHTSSLLYIFFYFIKKIRINPYFVVTVMGLVFIFGNMMRSAIFYVSNKLGLYSEYFNGEFDNGSYGRILIVHALVVMLLILVIYFMRKNELYEKINTELQLHYMGCLIVSMISLLPTPSRLLYMFIPVYITLVPNLLRKIDDKYLKIYAYFAIVLFYCIFFYLYVIVKNTYMTLPYQDVFGWFN
ncbi:EpsG family protein [Floricoccus penangensis]|uniref:EpsG family protein n=1 Tax=Floricoccus penangensis TaxID=1859475 RepID=UPI00203EAD01|nr:EpsG family protein [Floricoccus penangensis]URZ87629.1 EpsG family protein [Floricoccus penangensis]